MLRLLSAMTTGSNGPRSCKNAASDGNQMPRYFLSVQKPNQAHSVILVVMALSASEHPLEVGKSRKTGLRPALLPPRNHYPSSATRV